MTSIHNPARIALLTASLLTACGTAPTTPSATPSGDFTHALTVPITAHDDPMALAQRHQATVLAFEPQAGFAVLGLTSAPAGQRREHATLQVLSGGSIHLNKNALRIHAGANLWTDAGANLWTDAGANLWTDAGANLWTDGTFNAMPQNTSHWQQVRLEEGQATAQHRGAGVKVAVIDTGVDLHHPALQAHLADPADFMDYVDGDRFPDEEGTRDHPGYGHGTHVASIVVQFAPAAKIMPIRVLNPDGQGDATNLAKAIIFAAQHGAHVINLSLGAEEPIAAVEQAIAYAEARGVFVVSSAGNRNRERLDYPASSAHLSEQRVSVGSVDASDTKSTFSNYATTLKLSAPGELIWGLAPEGATAAWTGTSASAPMTSGALALALGEAPHHRERLGPALQQTGANLDQVSANAAHTGKLGTRLDVAHFLLEVTGE